MEKEAKELALIHLKIIIDLHKKLPLSILQRFLELYKEIKKL